MEIHFTYRVLGMFNKLRTKESRLKVFSVYLLLALFAISILYSLRRFALRRARTEMVIRILCFGDSLTSGMTDAFEVFPYSTKLQEHFEIHDRTVLGASIRPIFEVHNAGVPGERAKDQMLPRLNKILQEAGRTYSWIIILGGTNDMKKYWKYRENTTLLDIEDARSIFHALVKLHNVSHVFGARTVAVSIPDRECEAKGTCYQYNEIHKRINALLRDFSSHNREKVILADLANELFLPRDQRLWSGPVHLNKEGYDKMADVIYNSMKEHV